MNLLLRKLGYAVLLTMIAVFVFLEMTGPRGIPSLVEKRQRIRALRKANAELARENQERRERIERLENDSAAQEIEVRKRLKSQREGSIDFYLPPDEVPQPPAEDNSSPTVP